MKKWITDIVQGRTFDATRQAKLDIARIGQATGYQVANIFRYNDVGESDEAVTSRIDGITAAVSPGDFIVYQYPSLNSGRFEMSFVDQMHRRRVKMVCLIHDSETLRNQKMPTWIDEIGFFNKCDVLIVHNRRMAEQLKKDGVTTPMVCQYLLDYLDDNHDDDRYYTKPEEFKRGVVLAGNILKSRYLADWSLKTPITVFGVTDDELDKKLAANPQVDFRGQLWRWDLIQEMPRTFGLAWDSDTPSYRYNDYTHYNHPHKVSMYLSHGLPVIVWRQAAVADIIVQNHLGIAIDSLDELDDVVQNISDDELADMIDHVNEFGKLIRDGWFTRQALQAAEQMLVSPGLTIPTDLRIDQDHPFSTKD
ncbi:sugar transferase [Levilactobacillus acidifarinae]|nr:sugar transferase [Levilactobacillus acidifarinae]GEO70608.1 beta-1,6-galactofuranosyltransferase [Levilactobacillus acidifarinae]